MILQTFFSSPSWIDHRTRRGQRQLSHRQKYQHWRATRMRATQKCFPESLNGQHENCEHGRKDFHCWHFTTTHPGTRKDIWVGVPEIFHGITVWELPSAPAPLFSTTSTKRTNNTNTCLLLFCVSSKCSSLLRTCPPNITAEFANNHDFGGSGLFLPHPRSRGTPQQHGFSYQGRCLVLVSPPPYLPD